VTSGAPPGDRPPRPTRRPGDLPPHRGRTARYWLTQVLIRVLPRAFVRLRVEGTERWPRSAAIVCFNHLNWADPIVLMGAVPARPWFHFFGPKEEDMMVGGRNRLMRWSGISVPYWPGGRGLVEAARRVKAVLDDGAILAFAAEGRIHIGERIVPPLSEGAAWFAIRNEVPLLPVAINGTSWLAFGRTVRIRVGEPIDSTAFEGRAGTAALTALARVRLEELLADFPERPAPGRFGRWLTEVFNEWTEGARPPVGGTPSRLPHR